MPNYIANLNPNPVNGLGVEDLLLSQNLNSVQQTRGNLTVTVTPINAHNIPYGGSDKTIADVIKDTTSIEERFNSLVGDSDVSLSDILSKIDTETTDRLNTINKLNTIIDKLKDTIVNDYIGRISAVDAAVANEANRRESKERELIEDYIGRISAVDAAVANEANRRESKERELIEDYRRLISELEKSLLAENEETKKLIYTVAENYKKADSKLEDDLLEVKCKLSKFVEAFGNAINKDDNSIDITDELVEAVDNVKGLLCH